MHDYTMLHYISVEQTKRIGFESESYTVVEDSGPVEFCGIFEGTLLRDFVVTLFTEDGTATGVLHHV